MALLPQGLGNRRVEDRLHQGVAGLVGVDAVGTQLGFEAGFGVDERGGTAAVLAGSELYRHHRRYRITEGAEEIQMRRVAGYMFGFMDQKAPKGVAE